ncbi:DUF4468 domain-containing protein [Chryseobacterium aquaticum]|uniref:DUF4468 domain-containing protein n=1 Tax=Chryseobacterium aquaticum subsp. greenlandense TaxID=345663 RepID=A0A101CDU4_9FLAO|nr:DUF4468 domain-containing protein [Chryseobacterium aquaticum]KUJ53994.1 hypothetical protein AR686_17560 [Chryseobacterium aquaticum subsp. greenlandense]
MKKLLTFFILLFSTVVFSQELQFEEVVKVDSTATKDELFNRARTWFGKTYNNEKFVISTEDRVNGEISGNGSMTYRTGKLYFGVGAVIGDVNYKVNIFVKDGRYKYLFHSFRHEGTDVGGGSAISYGLLTNSSDAPKPSRGGANNKAWNDIKEQTAIKIKKTIESLKEAMNKKYEGSKEW